MSIEFFVSIIFAQVCIIYIIAIMGISYIYDINIKISYGGSSKIIVTYQQRIIFTSL